MATIFLKGKVCITILNLKNLKIKNVNQSFILIIIVDNKNYLLLKKRN